jgi:hypothetical protein
MSDDDHRYAVPRKVARDGQYFADQLRVERRGGFVEEHHLRVHGEGARDRDSLLLSSGQRRWVLISLRG